MKTSMAPHDTKIPMKGKVGLFFNLMEGGIKKRVMQDAEEDGLLVDAFHLQDPNNELQSNPYHSSPRVVFSLAPSTELPETVFRSTPPIRPALLPASQSQYSPPRSAPVSQRLKLIPTNHLASRPVSSSSRSVTSRPPLAPILTPMQLNALRRPETINPHHFQNILRNSYNRSEKKPVPLKPRRPPAPVLSPAAPVSQSSLAIHSPSSSTNDSPVLFVVKPTLARKPPIPAIFQNARRSLTPSASPPHAIRPSCDDQTVPPLKIMRCDLFEDQPHPVECPDSWIPGHLCDDFCSEHLLN